MSKMSKRRKRKKQKNKIDTSNRNINALMAWNMSGAGSHGNKKKKRNKEACRGKQE